MITPSLKAEIVSDRFDERLNQITNEIDSAMMRAGEAGLEESNRRVKVKTGHLKSRTQFIKRGFLFYEFFNDAEYGHFLNWGTRHIQADHWFDISAMVLIRAFNTEANSIKTRIR